MTTTVHSALFSAIKALYATGCSLAVAGDRCEPATYNRQGVRDLMWLLDNEPWRLSGAAVADKVIGRAAAGIIALAGVKHLYAAVLSDKAVPVLQDAGIDCLWGRRVPAIVIPDGDNRCPLERIVADALSPADIVATLRRHFSTKSQS